MSDEIVTRAEHLAWAKARALEYVDRGDLGGAVASMISDLQKHHDELVGGLSVLGILEIQRGPDAVRRWIEGFNWMADEIICVSARVTVQLELAISGRWGAECTMAQVQEQANEEAMRLIQEMVRRGPGVIREPRTIRIDAILVSTTKGSV